MPQDEDGPKASAGKVGEIPRDPEVAASLDKMVPHQGKEASSKVKMRYVCLALLTAQNAVVSLVTRYSRTREGVMYLSTSAVVFSEIMKLVICLAVLFFIKGSSISRLLSHLREQIFQDPVDLLKVSVPALIYTIQNNLTYVAISNVDASTYQVTYQMKILTTALFSVLMMKKQLSKLQWISLVILVIGVGLVQIQPEQHNPNKPDIRGQNALLGLSTIALCCTLSGFSAIYFEKMLKGSNKSIWIRNAQLAILSIIIGGSTMAYFEGESIRSNGILQGYDWVVWFIVFLMSTGGLLVSLIVKYADSIIKGFACSAAIVFSCIAQVYLFDFLLSIQFVFGAFLVCIAVFLYSSYGVHSVNSRNGVKTA